MLEHLDREEQQRINLNSVTDARGWAMLFSTGYFRDNKNSDPLSETLFLPFEIKGDAVESDRSELSNATREILKKYLHSGILPPKTVGLLMAAFPGLDD